MIDCPLCGSPQWISIEDRLPPNNETVLILSNHGDIALGAHYSISKNWSISGLDEDYWDREDLFKIEYWMSLPERPIEG